MLHDKKYTLKKKQKFQLSFLKNVAENQKIRKLENIAKEIGSKYT